MEPQDTVSSAEVSRKTRRRFGGGVLRDRPRTRSILLETAATLGMFVAVGVVALAFAWPWLPREAPGGEALARYLPLQDGESVLFVKLDQRGTPVGWLSQNRVLMPWLGLYSDVRKAPSDVLLGLYGTDPNASETFGEQMRRHQGRGQIVTSRLRELDRAGKVSESLLISLRDERGEMLVGISPTPDQLDLLYDPPAQQLPPDLDVGSAWEQSGTLGPQTYRWQGRVMDSGAFDGMFERFEDCLRVDTRLVLATAQTTTSDVSSTDWYCAGLGLVESNATEGTTGEVTRTVLLRGPEAMARADLLPPPSTAAAPAPEIADPASWELTRVGRGRISVDAGETTVPPLWIPTDPPTLLVAGYAGDLIALDAGADLGVVKWRFHPPGTIYGPPAFDAVRRRVYVGAGDRRLYALDARGLYLWSFETGDNVATRPLVLPEQGLVLFGSEDGNLYALDADTGEQRWKAEAGGAVVSFPVLVGGQVAFASDDGSVYGLDPVSGERHWQYAAGGPVEATIALGPSAEGSGSDDDSRMFYVASRDGSLAAVALSTCQPDCTAAWEASIGRTLRQAPAVGNGAVFVVDEDGYLYAFDAREGNRLWSPFEPSFVGSPLLVDGVLVVARKDGFVSGFDAQGTERFRWSSYDARGPLDDVPAFTLGPVQGGGAIWLGDTSAVIRRLGGPESLREAERLPATLAIRATQAPFEGSLLLYTPVEYQGIAVVLDAGRGLNLLDPTSARGVHGPEVPGDLLLWPTDPVVAGDRLLVSVGNVLHAVELPTGRPLWELKGGLAQRPVTVAGDTVLWVTSTEEAGGTQRGTLTAVGLADGAVRWQAPVAQTALVGGAVADAQTVYVSTPPAAFDLTTGAERWRVSPAETPVGGPALSEDGTTLYVGEFDLASSAGSVIALDTASGRQRWRAELGSSQPAITEQLWLDRGMLVVPAFGGAVIGLDATTGRERWRYRPTAPRLGAVTVASGLVWLVQENARVIGVDTQTGRARYEFRDLEANLNGGALHQRPGVVGDHLVLVVGRLLLGFLLP